MRVFTTTASGRYLLAASGLSLALAACSSEPEATPAPAVEDATGDAAASAPVKDVTWSVGDPPASWVSLDVGQGERQWQVAEECLFTMDQPSGIDPDQVPVEQVLQDTGMKIQNALGFAIDSGPIKTQSVPVTGNEVGVATADVSTIDYTSQAGASGSIYAYRAGEYALIIYTACSANVPFDEVNEQDFAPFIDEQVSINLEY